MQGDEISEEGRCERFARWERLGVDQVKHDLLGGGDRVVGGPPAVRELAWQWVRMKEAETSAASQEKALIEAALALGVPIDDLLAVDGERLGWKALRDFKVLINHVLVEFHKDDVISDWTQILELQKGKCPITSLKSELWRRLMIAQPTAAPLRDLEPDAMARRPAASPSPPPAPLALAVPRSDAAEKLRSRIAIGKELQSKQLQSREAVEAYKKDTRIWSDFNEELLKRLFSDDSLAREYSGSFFGILLSDEGRAFQVYRESIDNRISTLESILGRLELYREPSDPASMRGPVQERDLSKVFVVHGHDGEARETVARFIEKLGFEAIVLHERPNKGRTIITKFQEEAAGVGFAVVLMTPDDEGKARGTTDLKPRARQNVVFELGFFIGALRVERVAALVKGAIERPSDFDGVVYISLDDSTWQMQLGRELKEAGYPIDWNRVMG